MNVHKIAFLHHIKYLYRCFYGNDHNIGVMFTCSEYSGEQVDYFNLQKKSMHGSQLIFYFVVCDNWKL